MSYWLMKSEPSVYGIDDLKRDGTTAWEGVRNYQVRNLMRDEMKPGDKAFLYHSSCPEPGIVGIMTVAGPAKADPTQFQRKSEYYDPKSEPENPTWLAVDVRYGRHLPRVIGLEELRRHKALAGMLVLRRGNRLSISPVTPAEWRAIEALI